jgi:hypothetical protein
MTHFSVGEHVTIRYGKQRGQKATIIKNDPPDAYRVKLQDGWVLFFSGKGLERESTDQTTLLETPGTTALMNRKDNPCLNQKPSSSGRRNCNRSLPTPLARRNSTIWNASIQQRAAK